jgi:hypothetical protein
VNYTELLYQDAFHVYTGKQSKIPWKVKGVHNSHLKQTIRPDQCVYIDQMESSTPGLIAQMKGIPTIQRYTYTTSIVDHYSRNTYIHMHTAITSEQTILAKHAFESMEKGAGVRVEHWAVGFLVMDAFYHFMSPQVESTFPSVHFSGIDSSFTTHCTYCRKNYVVFG